MFSLAQIFYIFNTLVLCSCLLRGVPFIRQRLYDPSKDFTCFDGSSSVPFSYVNDDYCDCSDGSDEPGTSACPNSVFYCENKGYEPSYIPSSRVNDGYCDCCDASDEYLTDNCSNICEALGLEARLEAERIAQMFSQGSQMRLQMVAAGKQIVREKQDRLLALENEKTEAGKIRDEKESLKKVAEEREATAMEAFTAKEEAAKALKAEEEKQQDRKEANAIFSTFDSNKDDKLQTGEIRSRTIFDQNRDGQISDDEVKFFFDIHEEVSQDEFYEVVWPRLKPQYLLEKVTFLPPMPDAVEEKIENEDHLEPHEDKDTEDSEHETNEGVEDAEEEEEEEGIVEPDVDGYKNINDNSQQQYDEVTAKIVADANAARSEYDSAQRTVQDIEREINQLKESLSKDYGQDDEFAPLDGQCFSYTDLEYIYKICPFDQVVQAGKGGGSETRLGSWHGWLDSDYSTMFYDKGQSCWNGPQRSAKVNVSCGLENEVISASEPDKCEYFLEFRTPAACRLPDKPKESHDEL